MTKYFISLLMAAAVSALASCAVEPTFTQSDVNELAAEIRGLGPSIDPREAERAASIAYSYSLQLAQEYKITDSPIVHNAKIYQGYRERGLCNHWTEDLSKRLKQEGFQTLTVHWATSPPTEFRIIHHTVIISARGDSIYEGVILDPWRNGGTIFWSKTQQDDRYDWRPRMEVREDLINSRTTGRAG